MAAGLWAFFEGIGNLVVPYWILHFIDNILNFFRPSHLYRFKHANHESWALVTGASDGIGEGFAHELAARGFHVILHGRNTTKLREKEALLRAAYPSVKTRTWIADATEGLSQENLANLEKAVHGLHLTLLINNVGGLPPGGEVYAVLEEQAAKHIDRTMQMNIGFTTKLTARLMPKLLENQPSGILNISSLGCFGSPFVSVYAGTKGYINSFSLALQCELSGRGKDVTVHSVLVGKVISGSLLGEPGFATPTSRTMAAATLDNIGLRGCVMAPYLPHLLQVKVLGWLPEGVARRLNWDAMVASMDMAEKMKTG